jgi:cobalt-zinc-cadmium efflux system outer membrane protein
MLPRLPLLAGLVAAGLFTPGNQSQAQGLPTESQFGVDRIPAVRPARAEILPLVPPLKRALGESQVGAPSYGLHDFVRLGLERHPRLAQAGLGVEAARGRAIQAGLYPNPTVSATFDELGDRTGRGGVNTVPLVSQEIVTGGKLALSRAAAEREVDQATLAREVRRADLLAGIRSAYFDLLALQRRAEELRELRTLTQQSVAQTRRLVEARQAAGLDVIQLEVEAERARAEAEAAEAEMPAAFRRLAAAAGAPGLARAPVAGSLDDPLPDYDLGRLLAYVLAVHPDVRSAQVGLERARLLCQRAQAEAVPNVTLSAGYVRQNQNRSNDATVGVSLPVPVWNRNQGNILAAQAQVGEAAKEVQRVENDLTERVATAYRDYAAARRRADRLTAVQAKAEEAFRLISDPKNINVTAVQRLVAQQAVAQARLDYARSRGEAWRAAAVISGLALETEWPARTALLPATKEGPAKNEQPPPAPAALSPKGGNQP